MKLWAALLHLYPGDHRRTYGEEMLEMSEHRWQRAGGGAWVTLTTMGELIAGAIGVWGDRLRRGTMGMGRGWLLDTRFVVRSLSKSGGYVTTAIVVLAAAVAVNATVFSYVNGTLLSEAPWEDPDQVVIVWGNSPEFGQLRDVISGPNYIDLKDHVTALSPIAAVDHDGVGLIVDGRPEVHEALKVTVEFLSVLGVEPMLGRSFGEEDRTSSAAATVIVTYAFWRDRLDSDPAAVGTTLPFAEGPTTIIGVLPEGFEFLAPAPFFVPLRDDELAADGRERINYNVLGRLVPGGSIADVALELDDAARAITIEYPGFEGWGFLAEPLQKVAVESVRPVILFLSITVALVLLVALVNLAMLFRIRAMARSAELGVRQALGAGKLRLARVLALETAGLATVGAGLGLVATPFLLERVTRLVPSWVPIADSASSIPVLQATLSREVAALTFLGAVLGALLLAAPTFVHAVRSAGPSRSGTRVHNGIRGVRTLVGVEVAVATVLCIAAGLTARTASGLLSTDVGIDPDNLLVFYGGNVWDLPVDERVTYLREVVETIERVPGVRRAGVMGYVDFEAEDDFAGIIMLDRSLRPRADIREEWRRVDEGLFETAGMSVVRGRAFSTDDFVGVPRTAIVNAAFADKHYPGRNPIGERLSTHDEAYQELEIVGVLRDVRSLGPATPPPPMLYAPYQGNPRGWQGFYVRVEGTPMAFADQVHDAASSVDPSRPITGMVPMADLVGRWVAIPLATRALVLTLALLAALLAAVGVFGVVAYAVRTRRSELGVRLALGASPVRLERELLQSVLPVAGLSIGAGTVIAVGAARVARALLYGVSPLDPLSIMGALVAMSLAIGVATWLPARRAARINPTEAMRAD